MQLAVQTQAAAVQTQAAAAQTQAAAADYTLRDASDQAGRSYCPGAHVCPIFLRNDRRCAL